MGKLLIPLLILAFWVMSKLIDSAQKRANAEKARKLKKLGGKQPKRDEGGQSFEAESGDIQEYLEQMGFRRRSERQPEQQPERQPEARPAPAEPQVQQFVSQTVDQHATRGVDQHAAHGVDQNATHGVDQNAATGSQPERGQAAAAPRRARAKPGKRAARRAAASEPIELTPVGKPSDPFGRPRLRKLTATQQAIVTMELLGPPRSLREYQVR